MPSVADRIRELWKAGRALFPAQPTDNLSATQALAWSVYRDPAATENDSQYFHFCALALALWERFFTHTVQPEITDHLRKVPLRSVPRKQPRLFDGPWLIEVNQAGVGERLFGDTVALGAYYEPALAGWALIGWRTTFGPLSAQVVWWFPEWNGESVQDTEVDNLRYEWRDGRWAVRIEPAESAKGTFDADAEWANQAIQFAMLFAIVLEAKHAPIRTRDIGPPPPRPRDLKRHKPAPRPWLVRYVYPLDPPEATTPRDAHQKASSLSRGDYRLSPIAVRGHYRLQHRGEGGRETEWIFIQDYDAHRWTSTTPVKVVVGKKGKSGPGEH